MLGPDAALRRLMREVGKLLQPYGFHGSEGRWLRVTPDGVAAVGRTRTVRTWTDGQQVLRFGLALSATPTAWWEFCNWRNAQLGLPVSPLGQASGPGLLTEQAMPEELTELWALRADPAQPGRPASQADIDLIRAELPRRVHTYARRALRLLEPGRYLEELLADPDPQRRTLEAIIVLLAEHGPGERLDEAALRLRACPENKPDAEHVIAYARGRAALVETEKGGSSQLATDSVIVRM